MDRKRPEITSATIGIAACVLLAIAVVVYYAITDDGMRAIVGL